jgi:hypothetical protein
MGPDVQPPAVEQRSRRRSIVAGLIAAAIMAAPALGANGGGRNAAPALERFLEPDAAPLRSYRALRRLTASTRGGKMQATLVAWTELDPARGFRYQVISRSGSPAVQSRALIPALETEAQSLAPGDGRAALTRANYRFDEAVNADGLVRVGVTPHRAAPMLLEGWMYLQPDSGDLVRVEGRLVKRPSFWTRRVEIVRHYARLAGVRVPIEMESTGQVLILGPSSFDMTWEYESVNGIAVGTPGARAAATSGEGRGLRPD